jgi:dTDP-4-dehydrorhamnose 3,5-epimerase
VAVTLDAKDRSSLFIPAGCANAYLTLSRDTVAHYYMSERYSPSAYRGFRYDDPAFKFEWPAKPRVISKKDSSLPDFDADAIRGMAGR